MAAVTEILTTNLEFDSPNIELVQFQTANSGDYFLSKKLKYIDGAFASQEIKDGEDVQVSWGYDSNGQPRVTLTLESENIVSGFLTIFGRP